jgi:hypothetical protein
MIRVWGAHERDRREADGFTARRARFYLIVVTNSRVRRPSLAPAVQCRGLRFGLRKLLGTRGRDSRVRHLVAPRSGPSTCFDELPLSPRLDLLKLC